MADASAFPAVSIPDAYAILTAPGMPFEMETIQIRGRPTRVYKNAPPNLRLLLEASRAHGAREFMVYDDERMTFDEHYRAVAAFARVLADRYGAAKGDRIAIAMRNLPEWSIAFWAGIALGCVVTPLNGWGTGDDLAYGVSDSGAKIAIVDAERLERIAEHLERCPDLKRLYVARQDEDVANPLIAKLEDVNKRLALPVRTISMATATDADPADATT